MADVIKVPDVVGGVPVSVEQVNNLNGVAVSDRHLQRFFLALRTAAGVAVDIAGTLVNGILVDVSRVAGDVSIKFAPAPAPVVTQIAAAIGLAALAPANANRTGIIIWNNSASRLLVKLGAGAAIAGDGSSSFYLDPDDVFTEFQFRHVGIVSGWFIDADPAGFARVTDL